VISRDGDKCSDDFAIEWNEAPEIETGGFPITAAGLANARSGTRRSALISTGCRYDRRALNLSLGVSAPGSLHVQLQALLVDRGVFFAVLAANRVTRLGPMHVIPSDLYQKTSLEANMELHRWI